MLEQTVDIAGDSFYFGKLGWLVSQVKLCERPQLSEDFVLRIRIGKLRGQLGFVCDVCTYDFTSIKLPFLLN